MDSREIQTHTLEELDRSVLEPLRLGLIALGILVDRRAHLTAAAWQAAMDALRTSLPAGLSLADVRGVGTEKSRDQLTMCRVSVDRITQDLGSYSAHGETFHRVSAGPYPVSDETTRFERMLHPSHAEDITYEIRTVADSTKMDRVLVNCVRQSLGTRRHIGTIADDGSATGRTVLLEYLGSTDVSAAGLLERIHRYVIRDVVLEEPRLLYGDVRAMLEGSTEINPASH